MPDKTIPEILDVLNNELVYPIARDYCGLSGIGDSCIRRLQLKHYWFSATAHTARTERIFQVGHNSEEHMIKHLESVGINVHSQQIEIIGTAGHWKGHVDGIAAYMSRDNLVEFKTHNRKSFNDLLKKGVLLSKPGHYDQMQSYMGYLNLPYALYMAECKDDSTYYFELVEFNPDRYQELVQKEIDVITTDHLVPRIGNNKSTWFECQMCNYKKVCFGRVEPQITCRTCTYVEVCDNGVWDCTIKGKNLTTEEQRAACCEYKFNEELEVI